MSTRYQNLTGRDVCPYCEPGKSGPTGLVHVATRSKDGMAEYGPCPHCEAGERVESKLWRNGYWQGRPPDVAKGKAVSARARIPFSRRDVFVDFTPGEVVELSQGENYLRARLLMLRYSGRKDIDPAVGIDIGSGERRRALVERELAKVAP
jgi:hypothetical protein